ncbi:Hypothetical predicted protein [Octopus vulgaris]|uniref:Uncharacterized protein n=1 Tax=Octopus vulgaris TaxID=6645 RepID=A0AA36AQU7_OCTVU|nr:Hypothetical predicted protein [Octopus vulgaris]
MEKPGTQGNDDTCPASNTTTEDQRGAMAARKERHPGIDGKQEGTGYTVITDILALIYVGPYRKEYGSSSMHILNFTDSLIQEIEFEFTFKCSSCKRNILKKPYEFEDIIAQITRHIQKTRRDICDIIEYMQFVHEIDANTNSASYRNSRNTS